MLIIVLQMKMECFIIFLLMKENLNEKNGLLL